MNPSPCQLKGALSKKDAIMMHFPFRASSFSLRIPLDCADLPFLAPGFGEGRKIVSRKKKPGWE